jgi:hypothetical protein
MYSQKGGLILASNKSKLRLNRGKNKALRNECANLSQMQRQAAQNLFRAGTYVGADVSSRRHDRSSLSG